MLGRTFKGMSDDMPTWQTDRLLELETVRDRSTSVALRFARVKRYRPDKLPAEADTIETLRPLQASAVRPGRRWR